MCGQWERTPETNTVPENLGLWPVLWSTRLCLCCPVLSIQRKDPRERRPKQENQGFWLGHVGAQPTPEESAFDEDLFSEKIKGMVFKVRYLGKAPREKLFASRLLALQRQVSREKQC